MILSIGGLFLDYRALRDFPGDFIATAEGADVICGFRHAADVAEEISAARLLSEVKNGLTFCRVYITAKDHCLWVQTDTGKRPMIVFRAYPDFKSYELILDNSDTQGRFAFECFVSMFNCAALVHGRLILHGVLLEYEGKGFILSAPSGMGKTTHAQFWRENENALIINGDLSLCHKEEDGWFGYGMPWCGSSGDAMNRRVPLCGVINLERGEKNSGAQMDEITAFTRMFTGLFLPRWNEGLAEIGTDLFCQLLKDVPFYCFSCRPEAPSVDVLKAVLKI